MGRCPQAGPRARPTSGGARLLRERDRVGRLAPREAIVRLLPRRGLAALGHRRERPLCASEDARGQQQHLLAAAAAGGGGGGGGLRGATLREDGGGVPLLPRGDEREQALLAGGVEAAAGGGEGLGRGRLDGDQLHRDVVGEDRAGRHADAARLARAPLDDLGVQRLVRVGALHLAAVAPRLELAHVVQDRCRHGRRLGVGLQLRLGHRRHVDAPGGERAARRLHLLALPLRRLRRLRVLGAHRGRHGQHQRRRRGPREAGQLEPALRRQRVDIVRRVRALDGFAQRQAGGLEPRQKLL